MCVFLCTYPPMCFKPFLNHIGHRKHKEYTHRYQPFKKNYVCISMYLSSYVFQTFFEPHRA